MDCIAIPVTYLESKIGGFAQFDQDFEATPSFDPRARVFAQPPPVFSGKSSPSTQEKNSEIFGGPYSSSVCRPGVCHCGEDSTL